MTVNGVYLTLGRLPQFDEASRAYQIRGVLDEMEAVKTGPVSKQWTPGPTLNQGNRPACTGFSMTHRLTSDPVRNTNLNNTTAIALYNQAKLNDEWPGTNYEGSSVLGAVKAVAKQGYVSAYHWAGAGSGKVIDDIVDSLSHIGPVVFGIPWANSMFQPRHSGLLEVDTSDIAGGHAICATGVLLNAMLMGETGVHDVVEFQNSWGTSWGVHGGRCFVKLDDLETLMGMEGEACVITKENLVRK